MEDSIFYHEDYYKQIELIPQENYFKALKDINDNNTINTSYGFATIREREEPKIKTENLNISIDSVIKDLSPYTLKLFNNVTTGYSNTVKRKSNTIALGFERLALFFELKNELEIKNIWMCQSTTLPKVSIGNNLLNALVTLGNNYNLILVDWSEETAVRLSSFDTVKTYLQESFSFKFPLQ